MTQHSAAKYGEITGSSQSVFEREKSSPTHVYSDVDLPSNTIKNFSMNMPMKNIYHSALQLFDRRVVLSRRPTERKATSLIQHETKQNMNTGKINNSFHSTINHIEFLIFHASSSFVDWIYKEINKTVQWTSYLYEKHMKLCHPLIVENPMRFKQLDLMILMWLLNDWRDTISYSTTIWEIQQITIDYRWWWCDNLWQSIKIEWNDSISFSCSI